jgi:hypothetical protein
MLRALGKKRLESQIKSDVDAHRRIFRYEPPFSLHGRK